MTTNNLELLYETDYSYLTEKEFAFFVAFCEEKGINPWLRHIRPERVHNETTGRKEIRMICTIDALRVIALNTGQFQGRTGPSWSGPDGAWVDLWTNKEPPFAALVGVHRAGFRLPTLGTALWAAYCPVVQDRDGRPIPAPFWERMGYFMLAKCAEAIALRAAFPEKLSGLYTPDEMQRVVSARPPQPQHDPEGSERGWDVSAPTSAFQFQLALVDLGLQNPEQRDRVINSFRELHPHMPEEQFYKLVIAAVSANPGAFGAKLEPAMT